MTKVPDRIKESFKGVTSMDPPTRRMSYLFVASCIGLVFTLGFVGSYFYQRHQINQAHRAEVLALEKKKLEEVEEEKKQKMPPVYQSMGVFSLELREKPGVVRSRSSMNTAEMEIVVSCKDPMVCEWIKSNLDVTRGELSSLFVPMDRDQLLSLPGKKAFREEIREKINRLLRTRGVEGEVTDILFPRFIMSSIKLKRVVPLAFFYAAPFEISVLGYGDV